MKMSRLGIALILVLAATPVWAGNVFLNGLSVGRFESLIIDYRGDKTGTVTITTDALPGIVMPPAPVLPVPEVVGDFDLLKCYKSKLDLYTFIVAAPYRGTVIVDGVKIRHGVRAPVYFKSQPGGSVCR